MTSHFFAYLSRMKFIRRWGLMHSTYPENIQEHSLRVAQIAHALAIIKNRLFGGDVDPERTVALALYHDTSEVLTGDLPALDLGVELFDRRGQVAGEDLARVVVERQRHGSLGIDVATEEQVLDDRERVGDLRDAQAVLLDVLGVRAVHEPPAADELHPGQVREEVARHAAGSDSELWVQRVAEPVAEQVDAERREGERGAGERGEPPRDV